MPSAELAAGTPSKSKAVALNNVRAIEFMERTYIEITRSLITGYHDGKGARPVLVELQALNGVYHVIDLVLARSERIVPGGIPIEI